MNIQSEETLSARFPLFQGVAAHRATPVWRRAAKLRNHPRLLDALHGYCRDMCMPSSAAWPANKVFGQKFRYITAYSLIGNFVRWSETGEVPPTLKTLQDNVPASPRQVADLIKHLRAGGYVHAMSSPQDGRAIHLVPTQELLLEVARSPLACLRAAEVLGEAVPGTCQRLHSEPEFLAGWIGESVREYRGADILFSPFPTIVRFSERDAGYMALTAVIGCHYATVLGDQTWQLRPTQDVFARHFKVSRQHIGNLFLEARQAGLFAVREGKIINIEPDLVTEFGNFVIGQMAHYSMMAERVADRAKSENGSA
ncbi:MarR family transcriptional regulator [Rhizobium sp. P40RR-XXII]|uniref:MarR family transcriptional regulator n=1 Tax=Rhizobium sp. P40RR-XXII TaxID=2726739 RepID=UPI0014564C0F|nr:MarR family transcriptional regulator [Rhizobium sp. P40RR-XXII]NLS20065.1 MarR family transcriptional regulator [Rhizobium sp. P40RR-XXII]